MTKYLKQDILKYEDGWWITFVDNSQKRRIKHIGPFKEKQFALNEMNSLNNNYSL